MVDIIMYTQPSNELIDCSIWGYFPEEAYNLDTPPTPPPQNTHTPLYTYCVLCLRGDGGGYKGGK